MRVLRATLLACLMPSLFSCTGPRPCLGQHHGNDTSRVRAVPIPLSRICRHEAHAAPFYHQTAHGERQTRRRVTESRRQSRLQAAPWLTGRGPWRFAPRRTRGHVEGLAFWGLCLGLGAFRNACCAQVTGSLRRGAPGARGCAGQGQPCSPWRRCAARGARGGPPASWALGVCTPPFNSWQLHARITCVPPRNLQTCGIAAPGTGTEGPG
jgi:hypothetical protein